MCLRYLRWAILIAVPSLTPQSFYFIIEGHTPFWELNTNVSPNSKHETKPWSEPAECIASNLADLLNEPLLCVQQVNGELRFPTSICMRNVFGLQSGMQHNHIK